MKGRENFYTKKSTLIGIAFMLLLLVCIAYSNHFTNGFEFDDSHSIVNNEYIRDIKNIPLFFTDIKYSGTNPGNQGYRPVHVSMNAIDYRLAGKELNPVYFHADIFFFYLVLLFLLFFMFKNIFETSLSNSHNSFIALLALAFYSVHAANAETINYICMRSDTFSTLWIVASVLFYIWHKTRKYYLYLFTIALAMGTKETGAMCGPLLFFYILFFEENVSLTELITFRKLKNIFIAFKKSLPALLTSFGLFFFIRKIVIPQTEDPIFSGDTASLTAQWQYFYTQWVIIAHYIGNFILPLDLSADPDFKLFETVMNRKVLFAFALLFSLLITAFVTSSKKETRPIAFGILWFFSALAPTTLLFGSVGQIANDHRTFFPYIGLVLSVAWWLRLLYLRHSEYISAHKYISKVLPVFYLAVISLHAYGTYQRNKVWSSSEMLWYDASVKSPNNGRALMNYGLSLMTKGKYDEALTYFKKTLELNPYWAYIHINMGILREAMGFHEEAEQYFKNAINYQPYIPDGYYFFARWLHGKGRIDEAVAQLQKGNEISPGHTGIKEYLAELSLQKTETPEDRINKLKKLSEENPSAANFIELSLAYYKKEMYKECVNACEKALAADPKSVLAYNNMCSAYNAMKQWEKAAESCEKALKIDPSFERAKNNLIWAKKSIK